MLPASAAGPASAQWMPLQSNTNAEFRGLVAVSPTVVWASGTRGRVARTSDGGKTWRVDTIAGADTLAVAVSDPGCVRDVDTALDLEALR